VTGHKHTNATAAGTLSRNLATHLAPQDGHSEMAQTLAAAATVAGLHLVHLVLGMVMGRA